MKNPPKKAASPSPCYAHRHMTAAEYGFWDVCRALAHKTGTLYFNGKDIAARFDSMARSTAYLLAKSLVRNGWFKETKKPIRGAGGHYSSRHYKVLSHDEWIAEHPDRCLPPVHSEDNPIHNSAPDDFSPVHFTDSPVHFTDSPVHSGVHNLLNNNPIKKQPATEQPATPAAISEAEALVDRFSRGGRKRAKAAAEAAEAARAFTSRPVLKSGLDDSPDLAREAERLSIPITNQLGIQSASDKAAWSNSIERVLQAGHTSDMVRSVASFAYSQFGVRTMLHGGPSGFEEHFDQMAGYLRQQAARTTEGTVN